MCSPSNLSHYFTVLHLTFTAFSRRFYPKRLTISTFVRRRTNVLSVLLFERIQLQHGGGFLLFSVQWLFSSLFCSVAPEELGVFRPQTLSSPLFCPFGFQNEDNKMEPSRITHEQCVLLVKLVYTVHSDSTVYCTVIPYTVQYYYYTWYIHSL